MAKILLNVQLESKEAVAGLNKLVEKTREIANSLKDVKPNKNLTEQIKALSTYYKNLADAAQKAAKQTQNQAKADSDAAIQAAKKKKADEEAAAATKKRETAEANHAAALKRKEQAETNAAEAAAKHAAAEEKRAAAAAKAAQKDAEEEKPLWNLEKAYASLYQRITSAAEKYPLLADVMGRYGAEVKETHGALVEYNRGRSEEIEETDVLKERYDRLAASLTSVIADTKEESEAILSNQQEMEKWAAALKKADTDAEAMRTTLYGMLNTISSIENRYPAGTFDKLKADIREQISGLTDLDRENENYVQKVAEAGVKTGEFKEELAKTRAETEHAAPAVDTLGMKFESLIARYAKFYASALLVRKPLQMIQNALSEIGETLVKTEDAVIELNRVLDDPQPSQEISNRLYDLAYQYGSTFENASTIAANFARAGRSWTESIQATEAALLAMNVAELNATEASDGLLSIIAQFDMEASDLIDVVDKLNKTADKNPVSTQKLLQAIQRAGSAAKNANVSFDQTLGLITAISEATNRSGQNIGTAINSLIQYSTKNIDTFRTLSEESNAVVDRFKVGLASIVDVWNQVSIDIKNDKEARDNIIEALGTDDLEELSSTLHDELGDLVSEMDGVYNVANTYRKNYFIALLDNMDRYLTVQEQLTDYQGYSQEENAKYMETYTAKVNQLNDAWQKLANDEQGILQFKKDLVELGIGIVNLIDQAGGIVIVVTEIATAVTTLISLAKAGSVAKKILEIKANLMGVEAQTIATTTAVQGLSTAFSLLSIGTAVLIGIITATQAYNREQEQARQKTIDTAKAHAEDARSLQNLYQRYKELSPESEEYRDVENDILAILGDKADILPEVTRGTENYKKAVEELTQAQLAQFELEQYLARKAAEESLLADATSFSWWFSGESKFYKGAVNDSSARSVHELTPQQILDYYDQLIAKQEELGVAFTNATSAAEKNEIAKQYEDIGEQIDAVSDKVEAYRNTLVSANDIISNSIEETNKHIIGREGVVPNLEEVREKAKGAALSMEEIAEESENASESIDELTDGLEETVELTEENTKALEEITTNIKDLSSQIDDVQSALSFFNTVQEEYNEYGSLSIDTLQKLLEFGEEYLELIIDEEGQVRLNEEAVDALTDAKKDLLNELIAQQTQEYALNKLHEYMAKSTEDMGGAAVEAAQAIEIAAMAMAHFEGNEEGAKRAAEDFEEALHRLAMSEGVYFEDWEEDWVNDVKNFRSGLTSLYSMTDTSRSGWERSSGASNTSSSSSSSSGSTKDEYLEDLKAAVSLRESELTLMQHQGASQNEQIAKIQQIQAAIHDEAEYMRSIGASQEDINKLSSEWWSWQEKINKFAEDNAKAAEKAAEEARKAAEEQQKAAEEAIKAETARLKQVLSDDKARLTLMEKQGKSVSERVEKMKEIQQHLHDEAEWLRQIGAEQAEIDSLSAEWWDWQDKILKLYQEMLDVQKQLEMDAIQQTVDAILKEIDLQEEALEIEEKRLAVDEARLNLQEAINKARIDYIQSVLSDYITSLSDAETLEQKQRAVVEAREKLVTAQREAQAKAIVDAFKAEKAVKKDTLSLEEKRLAVEQARQALIDAENERTTRVYNEASGQWEYQANAKNVQSARDNLAAAIDVLNAYVEEQAWAEVSEAVEKGSVSEAEVLEILAKWAKESYGNGSPEFVTKIREAFRKAMGSAASPDSVSGQISAVDSAVKSLNDYLKSEAIKELKQYIAAGNTDAAGMRSILDRWLSMGEGGELYEWRDGLMATLTDAIYSGYYDDTKVVSQVEAVERAIDNLHNYFRNKFKSELIDALKNGTVQDILDAMERYQNELEYSGRDSDLGGWAEMAIEAVGQRDTAAGFWDRVENGQATVEDKRRVMEMMRANSEAWWAAQGDPAEQKRLADENLALGSMVGWHRNSDGRWYDEYGNIVYDKGGILHGQGGIKATNRPEAILDPDLTAQILRPGSDAQFRAFADALHLMFEHGNRTRYDTPVIRNPSVTDSHNTSYTVNGIPIPAASAERYTIAELFRMLPAARS